MRIVLFGTGPFAVPSFEALIDSTHDVVALVTRPVANSGKRRKTAENPTRDLGIQRNLEIFDPVSINTSEAIERLLSLEADLFVVCDYGQILSCDALAAARLGGINLHGSLLPSYRGAAPIHWAIYNGDDVIGVTIIHMTARLDGGPCLIRASIPVGPEDTTESIEPRLAELGVPCVVEAIEMLEKWDGQSVIGEIQDQTLATKAPRLKRGDGDIDFNRAASDIVNQIRAFQPWPGTFTEWTPQGKKPIRLIIQQAVVANKEELTGGPTPVIDANLPEATPGQVIAADKQYLIVQTGNGWLRLLKVQPAGKKPMPIADFLRGNPPAVGDSLGG